MGLFKRSKSDAAGSITERKLSSDSSSGNGSNTEANNPLRRLDSSERRVLKEQLDTPDTSDITYLGLMRYATPLDRLLQIIGLITCIAAGAALPLMTIVFGQLTQSFTDAARGQSLTNFQRQVDHLTLYFVYIFIGVTAASYIYTVCFIVSGENMTRRVRENYLRAILRQNIGYFDKLGAGEVTTRITADTNLIQDGISEKIGVTFQAVATFFSAFIIAFIKNWKLTLILISIVPALFISLGVISRFVERFFKQTLEFYSVAGMLAEEVMSSVRVTQSFGTQERLGKLYDTHLEKSEQAGRKKALSMALLLGSLFFILYAAYGLAFWEGSRLILKGELDSGIVVSVFFAVIIGAFAMQNIAPNMQAFSHAVAAGKKIFETIDRAPIIDVYSTEGIMLDDVRGEIELEHVKFVYPARPELTVLPDMSLHVPAGKVTALVGASGSGKSTIVGLVERFYDPIGGTVRIDGIPIKDINVLSLRSHISLVSQEPNLFATTVFDNVAFGLVGTKWADADEQTKREMVREACVKANASSFIETLPNGYDTHVGEKGMLLSGGQKQRVAIARAIISDPKILILDEATAALDTKSEAVVQDALDKAAHNRTTIVVAHRLATIKNADNIVVMSKGTIVEQGPHDALLTQQGAYYALVQAQRIAQAQKEDIEKDTSPAEKDEAVLETAGENEKSGRPDMLRRVTTGQSVSERVIKTQTESSEPKKHGGLYIIWQIALYNRTEWHYMLIGVICSVLCAAVYPAQAIVFSKLINLFVNPQDPNFRRNVDNYALIFFCIAIAEFGAYFGAAWFFGICCEKMVRRVRLRTFRTILRQNISWFDREENSTGALTSSLATQCAHLAALHGNVLGTILTCIMNLVASSILSLAVTWKLALVAIACLPVLLIFGYLRIVLLKAFQDRIRQAYSRSANFACEATSVIRTVASLTRERQVFDMYQKSLSAPTKEAYGSALKTSVYYALSQSIQFLINGLIFWYGATLIRKGELDIEKFFVTFIAITFGGQSAGSFFSFAADMSKAHESGQEILQLLERNPEIDVWSEQGERGGVQDGRIEFKDVHFRYPTRPDVPVLRGLNLTVEPGQYVALVGPSGCGKSTTIGLIERFYDPLSGTVLADGRDLAEFNLKEMRKSIALVSQEPTLYQGTIRFNITLGAHEEDVPEEAIVQACRDANILDFIQSLPQGFETMCGQRGTALSGGQKQRIAIARALIRKPKVLLLDEATSALDSESEKVVQAALDKAAKGRTTIAIAHRLSTIQRADKIYVFEGGRIVEAGKHDELVNNGGLYAELVLQQSLEKRV
ncbi:hypothetical protein PYCC9005_001863 [Savitreella phatthalungensis]